MKKIMFNDHCGLTKAVIEKIKNNTRRIEKPLSETITKYEDDYHTPFCVIGQYYDTEMERLVLRAPKGAISVNTQYKIDEIVAVAQPYTQVFDENLEWLYEQCGADEKRPEWLTIEDGWKNKMYVKSAYMPHQIKITGIRVERLQDITEEDCLREGILASDKYAMPYGIQDSTAPNGVFFYYSTPREAFSALIDKVSGKGTWERNPWVVAYTFKLVK